MVPCPGFNERAAWCVAHPQHDVGLHLALTSEWKFYRWGPVAPRDQVKSSDIYWGAIPWLGMQLVLVGIVILWPESVTYWLDQGTGVDPSTIQQLDLPPMEDLQPLDLAPPTIQ